MKFLKYFLVFALVFSFSVSVCRAIETVLPGGGSLDDCKCTAEAVSSPECDQYCGSYQPNDVVSLLIKIADIFLAISGSLALLAFVVGGVMMIISGGNKERVQKGQQILVAAVVGLIIIFSSYLIISFTYKALTGNPWTGGTNFPTSAPATPATK